MSIAKGLVLATDATLIGIASLDAMAWAQRGTACHAMSSLGRGRFAVASYPAAPWAPGSIDARNIAHIEPWHDAPIVCDADTADAIRAIEPAAPIRVVRPRPLDYAVLGVEVIVHHDPATFLCEPLYLGDPVQRP
jgi:tRNA A37 threonylcarbamoyladenosine modification protein TsaB